MKSFKGKEVDVSSILEQNATTLAVGNMRVNARGDLIGKNGKILKTREQLENEYVRNNPDAVKMKKENIAGFNKGLAQYQDKVLENEDTKVVIPEDPLKKTKLVDKNLSTAPDQKVKFGSESLDDIPLEDEFEITENVEKTKKGSK
jgi:hypothetical protein